MSIIPFDIREGIIWLDGQKLEWKKATIHVLNHGLHYGSSIFEGIRVYNYKPFKLREHYLRLQNSAEFLGFNLPYTIEELCSATLELIELNNLCEGYIRPSAWRGSENMLISGEGTRIHTAIAMWPVFEDKRIEFRKRGLNICFSKWRKPPANSSPYQAKAACIYTMATVIKNEATGYDDALILDQEGYITEATTSNFFAIKKNELFTPIADCFLNGITRQTLIELSRNMQIKIAQVKIKPDELSTFDAAFLSGTAAEITPIKKIEHYEFNLKNNLMQELIDAYHTLARS